MKRRQFLQGLAAATAAAWLPAVQAASSGFDAARAKHPFLAGWSNAPAGGIARNALETVGRLPAGLSGTLYRNGPAMFERNGKRYEHWFDGDGCVHAWRMSGQSATHEAAFVKTGKFRHEQSAGKFLYPAAGTWIPDALPTGGPDTSNVANTSVIVHNDRLLALWEGGSAYEIDPKDLSTTGPVSWRDDVTSIPFSAHPLIDTDGTMWNFGHLPYVDDGIMVLWQIDAAGKLQRAQPLAIGEGGYMHSFEMTRDHLIFVLSPWVIDAETMRSGESYFGSMKWQPEQGSLAIVVDKQNLKEVARHRLPAGVVYHWGRAEQRGSELHLLGVWHENGAAAISPARRFVAGKPDQPTADRSKPRMTELVLPLGTGDATINRVHGVEVEFPVAADDALYSLATTEPRGRDVYFNSVLRFGNEGAMVDSYHYGSKMLVEEHRPSADGKWLLGTLLDWDKQRSGISVLRADHLADGPVFQAWAPYTVPLGFHGCWQAA